MGGPSQGIEIFSTCPQSSDVTGDRYARRVAEIAQWSERHGCSGMLVYTDNRLVDPWLVAQIVVQSTERLCPLVAVQPVYKHPYAVAKVVSSFGYLYQRRVFLNLVAGGFRNDLESLGDSTPHDDRYDRLVEYGLIIQDLLGGTEPVTREGQYYRVHGLKLSPRQPAGLMPGVFVSGSSLRGLASAEALGATAIMYPGPPGEDRGAWQHRCSAGIRVGIIARETAEEAWRVAHARFPEDRRGEITHQLAMKTSDSSWHAKLSSLDDRGSGEPSPYWLTPFRTYKSFCPYLVGSHRAVAAEVARYLALGYRTLLLDIPAEEVELEHIGVVLRAAQGGVAS
jgi:alkanesulfonate monooxygenase